MGTHSVLSITLYIIQVRLIKITMSDNEIDTEIT